jgi:hypothetical protein
LNKHQKRVLEAFNTLLLGPHKATDPKRTRAKIHQILVGRSKPPKLTPDTVRDLILMFLDFQFMSQKEFGRIRTSKEADAAIQKIHN